MASILKVDTIQDQDGNNIINESANTITIGASGDTITIPSGATFASVGIDDNATSTAITIDSSENVGIGTSSPSEKLEVSDGKLLIKTTSGAAFLEIVSPGGTADSVINFGDSADNNVGAISYEHDNNAMNFRVNASTAMRIDSSGNVGIGTSSPDFPLEIYKASTSEVAIGSDNGGTAQLSFYENNSTAKEFFVKYDGLNNNGVIGTSAVSNAIVIPRDSGNVGIGTSSPDVKLQVQGASALGSGTGTTNAIRIHDTSAGSSWSTTQDFNQLQFSSGDTSNPAGSGVRYSIGVVAHDSANTYSNLTFRNYDGTEHMRINGAYGKIGINTSSPSGTFRTTIQEDETGHGCLVLDRTSNIDSTLRSMVSFERSGTVVGTITVNNTSTSYNTSSDYRLKENVVDMTNATDRLKQLQPKRFNFIANADTTVDGFLAHEVSSVVPEAISGTHNEVDDDGNPIYQGIDQSKLVPLLVKTIQELEARITALETQP